MAWQWWRFSGNLLPEISKLNRKNVARFFCFYSRDSVAISYLKIIDKKWEGRPNSPILSRNPTRKSESGEMAEKHASGGY
ncbi:hypothetical protein [Paraburkholderia sp. GAS199]|uniref:hypothetical protein n=1 Tax=Paraburkholderia sp. GAS199 TaxID=3035126 RepID=UPI003D2602B2